MMKILLLLSWLPSICLAVDEVALISDRAVRNRVMDAQMKEIKARGLRSKDCAVLLAPVPGETGTVPFAEATTALEKVVNEVASSYPSNCINTLLQELALITPSTPSIARIISSLNSFDQVLSLTDKNALACTVQDSGIEQLLALAEDTDRVSDCDPMENNKWKKVDGNAAYGNPINYSMQKNSTGVRVALNIDFRQAGAVAAAGVPQVSNERMMERARGCMAAVQGLIKDPSTGLPLQFNLLTPTEANRLPSSVRPDPYPVTIDHSKGFRSNAANYAHDADCPTIVHEMFHLVGLCDEYPGEGDGFICRSVPKDINIMSDTVAAFNASVPRTITCECTSPECKTAIALPGRVNFLKAPRVLDRTSARFRNAYCATPESLPTINWAAQAAAPPRSPHSSVLSPDGLTLVMTDYFMDTDTWTKIDGSSTECKCPGSDTRCRETMAKIARGEMKANTRECHYGMKPKDFKWGGSPGEDRISEDEFTFSVNPGNTPFMHPRQVQRILAGTCKSAAKSYYECAENAYATSPDECEETPDACLQSDFHERP
jgi:hypothetical protein